MALISFLFKTFKWSSILFVLLFSQTSVAAQKQRGGTGPQIDIQGLERLISQKDSSLKNTELRIKNLEYTLSQKNKSILKIMEKKILIEKEVHQLQAKIDGHYALLFPIKYKLRKYLKNVLVNSLDGLDGRSSHTAEVSLAKKLLIKKVKSLSEKIKALNKSNRELEKRFVVSKKEWGQILDEELFLLGALKDLEKDKSNVASQYMTGLNERDNLNLKYGQLKKRIKDKLKVKILGQKKKISGSLYHSPLSKYVNLDFKEKGITYVFKKREKVFSTGAGKIVYVGSLSTYGNVVMIDHGRSTRSIILGDFRPQVKKGSLVKKGEIVGETRYIDSGRGKLYFEVRKKNRVQNTMQLVDKRSLHKLAGGKKKRI
jgi:murein DD-endopeptidase MepM/ murein hydrolase activator NlpD